MEISSEGLFYRLSQAEGFLESVLSHLVGLGTIAPVGYRLLVVDATSISGPAATGTDFRFHVGYDPVRGTPCTFRLTGPKVGENLALHELQPGQLVLADRGYGSAKNVEAALAKGADVLLRVHKGEMRLYESRACERLLNWNDLESRVPETGALSWWFDMPVPPYGHKPGTDWRTSRAATWRKIRVVGARNIRGEVVWLATNLPEEKLPSDQACELYRARWQVELYFKRLKSIGDLDVQLSRDGPTARPALLAKLILLVLTSLLQDEQQAFSPYGYPIRQRRPQPLARVRLHPQTLGGGASTNGAMRKAPPQPSTSQTQKSRHVLA